MDPQIAGAQALGAAEPPRGPPLPSAREAPPSPGAASAPADPSFQERETEKATDRLANGAQSIPQDSPAHGEGAHSEEEGFAVDDEDSDGELNPWELSEGLSGHPPKEQAADLFNEDWDLELKADQGNPYDADDIQGCLSQEVRPWVCCAPQGDMIYDPSWHHPPPLMPHYSKMVFETGQFDDAED
ncbi:coordinator of PRMT5 and differentiation stimulator [Camelus ferus]|uniref:Coordinator of PRMT5 and differentiation stimulator n=3 Tax=Camelus TaxID=9836 RepID=A0A8B8R6F6_CAMFR|nr:coordinator of PRMT5 and differentiation stimulator [Camelus bactrianus]XP_032313566.1 coordinator of PRMT5 and differentiation stimulator [Camelus ferus]